MKQEAAADTEEGRPEEKKNKNQLTGQIFTSTVRNLIYKYILSINQKNKTKPTVVQSGAATLNCKNASLIINPSLYLVKDNKKKKKAQQ